MTPNFTRKTYYPRNHWSPVSNETANSKLRPDVGIIENDSSNVSAVTEITIRATMEESSKIIIIVVVSNACSILISSAVTFLLTRRWYRRNRQSQQSSQESENRNLLSDIDIAENGNSKVSIVTEREPQPRDHLYKSNKNVKIIGEYGRTCTFSQSEKYTKVTIHSLSGQEEVGHARTIRQMEGEVFWSKPDKIHSEMPLDRLAVSGTTLIIGPCGSGKSTTIRKIMHDWAAGKIYQRISAVFPFGVQQLNFIKKKMSLNDLLLEFFPEYESSLQHLWENPEKILFLFDDLNFLHKNFDITQTLSRNDSDSQSLDPEQCCEISHIVHGLVQGQLLKGCSVLVTSSPWKLQTLGNAGSNRAVLIKGFDEDALKEYFQSCFADGKLAPDVLHYVGQDKKLYAMCRNPQFCTVLCSVVESLQEEGAQMPAVITSTRVLLIYIMQLLNKYCYDSDVIQNMLLTLGSLAYTGICNNTIVFKKGQLIKDKLPTYNWISAFMMEIQGNDGVDYEFTYSILRDFVAALFKYSNTPVNQVTKLLTEWYSCTDDRFKFVLRFFIGLSSPNAMKEIQFNQGDLHSEIASNVAEWLKEKINSSVQSLKSERNQHKFLEVLHCLLEFGNATLMEGTLTPLKRIRFTKCPLETFDCTVLSRTLMMVQEVEELNLDSCGIKNEGICQLAQVLRKCKVLSLKSNNLTDACVEILTSALCENTVLLKLDISNDDADGDQANRLTDISIPALSQFIQSNTHMKEIKCSVAAACTIYEMHCEIHQRNSNRTLQTHDHFFLKRQEQQTYGNTTTSKFPSKPLYIVICKYIVKKTQQHMFFLRKLWKFNISRTTVNNLYRCSMETILSRCIALVQQLLCPVP
ncbi:NACHT, LRR and PYD domains-containing protein 12-like isoform X1 [Stegostoma tigrinum]|uniref:NACHT, LRR and PYD domains-containing protein 12-like isoform X1 n=1 Tax=Stegostoma tigrinum TaxID=3053191 RepID=UPI00286FCF02|nr:NACHT, LRR and PYD domains-containing protein 12-like isoform X1 [Stegostoma tigrinum]